MNQATISHPLFQQLVKEQSTIIDLLAQLDLCENNDDLKKLSLNLQTFAEIQHHEKEERLLFTTIYQNQKIHEGGPMCSLYFDLHQFENRKVKVEQIIGRTIKHTHQQAMLLKNRTPLVIPIEEHQSGRDLLAYILEKVDHTAFAINKINLELYKNIQVNHIKKEANCLYHMCAGLLSKDTADEILAEWIKDT
ncbi:MAG: hypothetical protein KDD37_11650 [Bdellovibrionales bacterium]|nr:hypothetical protein [Bdellovibrionales bacterium]